MSNELTVPDWLSSMMDQGTLASEAEQLVTATSVPRISTRGKVFRLIVSGDEIAKARDKIHVVILGVQPQHAMAKTFYKGTYSGENDPPTCSSTDGVRPDAWVNDKQASLCSECPQNVWGSAVSKAGKRAKACRDSKRLMVVMAKDLKEQGEDATIYILNVTVNSLKSLSTFGKELLAKKVPMSAVITTVTMVDDAEVPELTFSIAGFLNKDMGMTAMTRAAKREWDSFDTKQVSYAHDESAKPKLGHQVLNETHTAVSNTDPPFEVENKVTKAQPSDDLDSVDDLLSTW